MFLCFSDVGFDLVVCMVDLMLHLSAVDCSINQSLDAVLKVMIKKIVRQRFNIYIILS